MDEQEKSRLFSLIKSNILGQGPKEQKPDQSVPAQKPAQPFMPASAPGVTQAPQQAQQWKAALEQTNSELTKPIPAGAQSIQAPAFGEQKESTADTKEEVSRILGQLKQKMVEIDKITKELEAKRRNIESDSPRRTAKILEEIKVPPLEMLK